MNITLHVNEAHKEQLLRFYTDLVCNSTKLTKEEQLCKEAAERVFGIPFTQNKDFDLYNEELKTAIHYCGKQHYEYVPTFHKSVQDYHDQVQRDQEKLNLCAKNGIRVITVPYTIPDNEIEDYIRDFPDKSKLKFPDLTPIFDKFLEYQDRVPVKELIVFLEYVVEVAKDTEKFDRKKVLELLMPIMNTILPDILNLLLNEQPVVSEQPCNPNLIQKMVFPFMSQLLTTNEGNIHDAVQDNSVNLRTLCDIINQRTTPSETETKETDTADPTLLIFSFLEQLKTNQ